MVKESMIGIEEIARYIPTQRISNYEKKEKFQINDNFIENKIGIKYVSRKNEHEDTADLCCRAFQALKEKIDIPLDDIDCLVVVTQNPDGQGLPHTSAIVQGKLNISENTAAFDISLGCSGYVYSLSIVLSLMMANKWDMGLLFTADPYSKIINPEDKATSLLFGDASTVTLLSRNPVYILEDILFNTDGERYSHLQVRDRFLYMNGSEILKFTLKKVPLQIKELLKKSGLSMDEIDMIIFHQASKYMIDSLCKHLKLKRDRVPFEIAEYGNTISSSIPLVLEKYLHSRQMKRILISGFGVGLSWASAILNNTALAASTT